MSNNLLSSSIGKKILMAFSGSVYIGFLVFHCSANMLLFVGADAYNTMTYTLYQNKPLMIGTEILLVLSILVHVFSGIRVTLENKKARGQGYKIEKKAGNNGWASSNMGMTGSIILFFLIAHKASFRFDLSGDMGTTVALAKVHGEDFKNLYGLVVYWFSKPWYTALYIVSLILLGFHLRHAFESMFKTVGFYHPKYSAKIRVLSYVYASYVSLGFLSQAIWFGIINRGGV